MNVEPEWSHGSASMTVHRGSDVHGSGSAHCSFGQAHAWSVTTGPRSSWLRLE